MRPSILLMINRHFCPSLVSMSLLDGGEVGEVGNAASGLKQNKTMMDLAESAACAGGHGACLVGLASELCTANNHG